MADILADQAGCRSLRVRKWPSETWKGFIDKDGRWLDIAIASLCELNEPSFCGVFNVNVQCEDGIDNPNHYVAVVDMKLVDPEDQIRRELCVESFDALSITKILAGRRFVKKGKRKRPE